MTHRVVVYDLNTGDEAGTFVNITPREAVIAMYAHDRGDGKTWEFEKRYGHLVSKGNYTVACGDFAASLKVEEIEESVAEEAA